MSDSPARNISGRPRAEDPAQAALLLERASRGGRGVAGATGHDGALRRRLVSLFADALRDLRRSPEVITAGLRAARELSSSERRFVSDAVHDLLRFRRRLAFLAGPAGAAGHGPEQLLDALIAERRTPAGSEERLATLADPLERLAVGASFPDFLVRRFVDEYGLAGAGALCAALNQRAPLTVRANRIKCSREELAARLEALGIGSRPTPLAAHGLVLDTRQNVYSLAPFRDGWMELQDEGSQLIAELCAPPPRGTVIDACAGAGGKSLALAALLGNAGRVVAYDVSAVKLEELRKRARRAGLTNLGATAVPPEGGLPDTARPADRLLLDVPCSGTGALRRNPEARWRLTEQDLDELRAKQRSILETYAPLCAEGGRLIYATCSVLREENDQVISAFLEGHPAFEPVPAKEILGRERALALGDGEALRLLPHVHGTDGFFARVLRRRRR